MSVEQLELKSSPPTDGFYEEGGELDIVALHIQEIKKYPLRPELNRKLGAKRFAGQLALKALSQIAESQFLTVNQPEEIEDILGNKTAKFLLQQFNLSINNTLTRLKAGNYQSEKARQKDAEFCKIIEKHSTWVSEQVEKASIQNLINRQVNLAYQGISGYENLVKGNMRLVLMWARKIHGGNLELLDLISYGYVGLMTAAARYDFRLKFRFATYATFWIKQRIQRAITEFGSTIRVPMHLHDKLRSFAKIQSQLTTQLSHDPTLEELNEELGNGAGGLLRVLKVLHPASLNAPVRATRGVGFEEVFLEETIPDENENTEEEVEKLVLRRAVFEALETVLTPKEQKVIMLRFGFNGVRSMTLEEVGREFKVTRERIRQIEVRVLGKLRNNPTLADKLKSFLE